MFGKKKVDDDQQFDIDEDGNPIDADGNIIEGEIVEFDEDGNPIESDKDLENDETKSKPKVKDANKAIDKDALILQLSSQLIDIQKQIGELKNPIKSVESVKEPELVRPERPNKPRRPADFNLAEQNDIASSTYKYFIEMDEYQNELEEYRDKVDEYRDAKIERSQRVIEQSHQISQKEREAASIKASMLSKLQAKGLTAEESISAYDDAITGKLFDEEHIVALKMTERLNRNGKNTKADDFDRLKNKRERFGAIPPVNGNSRNKEVLEKDDFSKSKDTSHMYRPKANK
ncbi:MAG: hypothetical protein ACYDBX_04470 [Patescibacteria group bacterium]